jgi:tRNA dimethylallyltransferase
VPHVVTDANAALYLLTGPTAVGKTEWALRWAERHNAEIVSADSLLFYRGMDIGTAKPTMGDRARVPHHLIDICDVAERMDVALYAARARETVAAILGRGRRVLVTGGSGFYLKSFFAPVADEVDVPPAIRAHVVALSAEQALEQLRALNPAGLGELDIANPRRVMRALERCLAAGRTMQELAADFGRLPRPYADLELHLAVLHRDRGDLESRIEARVAAMLADGLVDEVRRLRTAGMERNPSAAKAIGYREVLAMFDGQLPEAKLAGEIAANTRALVKKQRTWFRTQLPAHPVVNVATLGDADELFGTG